MTYKYYNIRRGLNEANPEKGLNGFRTFDESAARQKYESFLKCPINNSSLGNIQLNEKELIIINGLKKSSNGMIPYITALNTVTLSIDGKNICEGLPLTDRLEFKNAVEHLIELGYAKKAICFFH